MLGAFTTGYVLLRLPVFVDLGRREDGLDPVGVLSWLDRPLPAGVVYLLIAATLAAGLGFTAGMWFRVSGPALAIGILLLATYRSSWGQMLHFENLIVLYVFVAAFSPAADAWSFDARRRAAPAPDRSPTAYGWPLALAAVVMVATYVIAGIAKLRYGGLGWATGDTLENHIAYAAARLDLLGGTPSPFAEHVVGRAWMLTPLAVGALVIELGAPVVLLGGRVRTAWVICAWAMHAGILAFMLIGFPVPLFGIAFAPLYRIERLVPRRFRAPAPAAAA